MRLGDGQVQAPAGPKLPYDAAAFLGAIIESSDDAIVSKSLSGVITTWNKGAERIFGYTADEVIGQPVTIIIPNDRLDEEPAILSRIQAGERVGHFETVRRCKDGKLIDISLTISPIRDASGEIVGASKIARDISERKRAAEHRELLLREMHHRVKNLFAIIGSIITLAARTAATPGDLASSTMDRLMALARAHEITLPSLAEQSVVDPPATLFQLLSNILAPYGRDDSRQWSLQGDDVEVGRAKITNLALLLHELATNSAKYGALSVDGGAVEITTAISPDTIELVWLETNGPFQRDPIPAPSGFGSILEQRIARSLNIEIERLWMTAGLSVRLSLPRLAIM
ncbi:histidine kinase [Rhizobium phaseoli]|uniref:PAS domain S-box protein n=1 Tax=Rhizobium phaseoli TaxID=396 RepID=UPI0003686C8D|nr:PAS domain S-box protein [Rhizobium phaseoli]KKZ83540.1 two component sensor kinase [Rhizobium phaseoli Ch24-10]RDJ03601.1 histidine kinase [Rhizobium phaseoli]RDJ05486.1 histidine kinase [Rhizobium phaseoli]